MPLEICGERHRSEKRILLFRGSIACNALKMQTYCVAGTTMLMWKFWKCVTRMPTGHDGIEDSGGFSGFPPRYRNMNLDLCPVCG